VADLPLAVLSKRPAASYGACLRPRETGTARSISSPSGKLPDTEQSGARAMSDHGAITRQAQGLMMRPLDSRAVASLRLDGRSTDSASRLRLCRVTIATAYQKMGVRLEFNEPRACLYDIGW
jgi:hypothetical protein